jgi:hypothetical protein
VEGVLDRIAVEGEESAGSERVAHGFGDAFANPIKIRRRGGGCGGGAVPEGKDGGRVREDREPGDRQNPEDSPGPHVFQCSNAGSNVTIRFREGQISQCAHSIKFHDLKYFLLNCPQYQTNRRTSSTASSITRGAFPKPSSQTTSGSRRNQVHCRLAYWRVSSCVDSIAWGSDSDP